MYAPINSVGTDGSYRKDVKKKICAKKSLHIHKTCYNLTGNLKRLRSAPRSLSNLKVSCVYSFSLNFLLNICSIISTKYWYFLVWKLFFYINTNIIFKPKVSMLFCLKLVFQISGEYVGPNYLHSEHKVYPSSSF